MGWLEQAWLTGGHVCVAVGATNWNALDNVLSGVADLIAARHTAHGTIPVARLCRLRGDHSQPPVDSRIEDIKRSSPEADVLVQALEQPSQCIIVGGTWRQLNRLAAYTNPDKTPAARWFDLLIIDEASQMPVAYGVPYYLLLREEAHVVLAGDPEQLGPIYGYSELDTEDPLFDCIFTFYQKKHQTVTTALTQNYRSNEVITSWPRIRHYTGGYESEVPDRRLDLSQIPDADDPPKDWPKSLPWTPLWGRLLAPELPEVVITYDASSYAVSNNFEAQVVAALIAPYKIALQESGRFVSDDHLWQEQVGIVTPHRAQMALIRNLLMGTMQTVGGIPPAVDTVDRFQGRERDLIIASYTVADKDFIRQEEAFLLSARRFNVTHTRARAKFILLVSNSIVRHLSSDATVARDASHLQLFVENHCSDLNEQVELPYLTTGGLFMKPCRLRGKCFPHQ